MQLNKNGPSWRRTCIPLSVGGSSMALGFRKAFREVWQTLSSIKTGVVLIILVVIFSAAGTVILQRPLAEPEDMQRAYSPQVLRILDVTGLSDVFHARWFVALMVLVSLSI